jgi:hypothetical protein
MVPKLAWSGEAGVDEVMAEVDNVSTYFGLNNQFDQIDLKENTEMGRS